MGALIGVLILCKVPSLSQLGTTKGGMVLGINLCLIAIMASIKSVRNSDHINKEKSEEILNNSSHCTETKDVTALNNGTIPSDLIFYIFSFLGRQDILSCSSVCLRWNEITKQEIVWKVECLKKINVCDDFSLLVEKKICTWRQVSDQYARLSLFLSRVLEGEITAADQQVLKLNPQFFNTFAPFLEVPNFFVKYGYFCFFIRNGNEIVIEKKYAEYKVLKENSGAEITHLAVEGEMLFALSKDGLVLQWHYLSGKFIQEISSAYSKADRCLKTVIKESRGVCGRNAFYVKDGYIILSYGDGRHKVCEVISYSEPAQNHIILDKQLFHASKILIKKEKLFLLGRSALFIWNLHKKQKFAYFNIGRDQVHFVWDFTIAHHNLYSNRSDGTMYVHDIQSKMELKKYALPTNIESCLYIEVIDNIVYGFNHRSSHVVYDNKGAIWAYDLLNMKFIGKVEGIIDFEKVEIHSHVLEELIKLHPK